MPDASTGPLLSTSPQARYGEQGGHETAEEATAPVADAAAVTMPAVSEWPGANRTRRPGVFAIAGRRQRAPVPGGSRYGRHALGPTVRLPCAAATATGRSCPADGPGRPPRSARTRRS